MLAHRAQDLIDGLPRGRYILITRHYRSRGKHPSDEAGQGFDVGIEAPHRIGPILEEDQRAFRQQAFTARED